MRALTKNDTDADLELRIVREFDDNWLTAFDDFLSWRRAPVRWEGRWNNTTDYLRWRFRETAAYPPIVACARLGDGIVGSVTVDFKRFARGDSELLAGELQDLAVAPELRRRGLFAKLVAMAVEASQAAGARFAYSLPTAAGAEALVKTGLFRRLPKADHATWLFPLRPLGLAGTRLRVLSPIAGLDRYWRTLVGHLSLRRMGRETPLPIEDYVNQAAPVSAPASWRAVIDRDSLVRRVLRHPDRNHYVGLAPTQGADASSAILKNVAFHGLSSLLLVRTEYGSHGGYCSALDRARALALADGAAFLAVWAPLRQPFTGALLSRGFVPVQRKRIVIAVGPGVSLAQAQLSLLHVEMLDSDKA
jgi:GNAT superfamily N-acetyltransferase